MKTFRIDKTNKTVQFKGSVKGEARTSILNCCRTSHYNPYLRCYIIPVTDYTRPLIVDIITTYGFVPEKDAGEVVEKFNYSLSEKRKRELEEMCEKKEFSYTPRLYQLEALNYALDKGDVIIGDDVGLGKTFESIMYAEVTESFPVLVIVPASVKYNWLEKWSEIVGSERVIEVIESKKEKKGTNNWNADVVVINFDILGRKQGRGAVVKFEPLAEIDWKMIIIDEAHFLKNSKSIRTKAAFTIKRKAKEAIVQLLTGTATMNKPVELWNLLRLVNSEKEFASNWKAFTQLYCGGHQSSFGWKANGATNTLELHKKLRETCYIRREKRDVLSEMPKVTKQVIGVEISNRKEYDFAERDFIEWVREKFGEEKAEKALEAESLVALGAMRKLTMQGKMKAVIQYLDDWKEVSTEKLVVFGIHREGLDLLAERYDCDLIAGGVSSKRKQEIVNDFKMNDKLFLFGNVTSAGTGVDGMQKASSNMLILELPWRPSDLEQVVGRLDRSGQELPVTVTFLLSRKTIDFDMWEMLAEKEKITEAVNKGIDIDKGKSGMRMIIDSIVDRRK